MVKKYLGLFMTNSTGWQFFHADAKHCWAYRLNRQWFQTIIVLESESRKFQLILGHHNLVSVCLATFIYAMLPLLYFIFSIWVSRTQPVPIFQPPEVEKTKEEEDEPVWKKQKTAWRHTATLYIGMYLNKICKYTSLLKMHFEHHFVSVYMECVCMCVCLCVCLCVLVCVCVW